MRGCHESGENKIMELVPVKHKISKSIEDNLSLAMLYENAGMENKAELIREKAILSICKENNITVFDGSCNSIRNHGGFDWTLKKIAEYDGYVPTELLIKMVGIQEKNRLMIGTPRQIKTDPILFYRIPHRHFEYYIEIASWE